jgi:hypothetical protein
VRNEQERGKQEEPFLSGWKGAKDVETQFSIAESENRTSLLKKSTDEFLRMRTSMFYCQIDANWSYFSEFSDVLLLSKALQ